MPSPAALPSSPENLKKPGEKSRSIWTWIESSAFAIRLRSATIIRLGWEDWFSIFPQALKEDPMQSLRWKLDSFSTDLGESTLKISSLRNILLLPSGNRGESFLGTNT